MRLTLTQRKILHLWSAAPASRTKHRMTELQRLVRRDLARTARLRALDDGNRRKARKAVGRG